MPCGVCETVKGTRLDLLDTLPKKSICAELGVWRGDFSEEILRRTQPRRLYLVDIFTGIMRTGDRDGENIVEVDMSREIFNVRKRFEKNPEVVIVQSDSVEWLETCGMALLDFCYIDTGHTYELTTRELSAASRAVRSNGIIAGHDYSHYFPGVCQAVDAFCKSQGLTPEIWNGDKLPSFKIQLAY